MKKLNVIIAAAFMVLMAQVTFGQSITTSAHNFSALAWNTSGQICKPCHTPHNANTTVANAPLWNHELSATAAYTLYSSATLNATTGQPDGSSKLCLSCHDGTVALANFGGATGGTAFVSAATNLGTSLANDHPISFTYNTALATTDGGLKDPSVALSGLGGTVDANLLIANKMQCSSCHDVHNGAGIAKLLVKTNAASALCLTCHNK